MRIPNIPPHRLRAPRTENYWCKTVSVFYIRGRMKLARPVFTKQLPRLALAVALCLCSASMSMAVTPTHLVESNLQDGTILTSTPEKLVSTVRDSVAKNRLEAGNIVSVVLSGGRADADAIASRVVVAAIEGLGEKPSTQGIASIVHYAVKATPAVVLEIVRAASQASPKEAVPAIVTAAVQAVPNPKEQVHPFAEERSRAGYSKDGKDAKDAKDFNSPDNGDTMPLSDAIAQAAHQGSGLDLAGLQQTANRAAAQALTAGVNNVQYIYYYPLFLPIQPTSTVSGTLPKPPVVSN